MSGGASFSTNVNTGFSGFEQRNRNWAKARNKWTVSVMSQQDPTAESVEDFDLVRNFHLNVGGQADGFRLYEPTDHSASLEEGTGILGVTGDGSNHDFQLTKAYKIAGRTYYRKITKPITSDVDNYLGEALDDTFAAYVNGSLKTVTTDYTLDHTTGILHFITAPSNGAIIAWSGDFHFPVRFASDDFKGTVQESDVRGGHAIVGVTMDLIEIRV